jgi:hypothetical protein
LSKIDEEVSYESISEFSFSNRQNLDSEQALKMIPAVVDPIIEMYEYYGVKVATKPL